MVRHDDDNSKSRHRSPHRSTDRDSRTSSHRKGGHSRNDDERGSSPRRKSQREEEGRGSSPRRKTRREEENSHRSKNREREERRSPLLPVKIKEEPQSDDEERSRRGNEGEFQRPVARSRRKSPRTEDAEAANYQYGLQVKEEKEDEGPPVEKQKPNFALSGKLTEEKNIFNGVVVKYSEPPEARIPKRRWRFYVFKGDETLPTLYLHRQSAYLMGRDRKVADIPVDHPSCSKQHAVLQFRLVNYERPDGSSGRTVRPYIIDLEAANGTFVNNQKIEPKRYVELFEKDVVKFGFSSREYVLLHEESKAEASLDDLGQ